MQPWTRAAFSSSAYQALDGRFRAQIPFLVILGLGHQPLQDQLAVGLERRLERRNRRPFFRGQRHVDVLPQREPRRIAFRRLVHRVEFVGALDRAGKDRVAEMIGERFTEHFAEHICGMLRILVQREPREPRPAQTVGIVGANELQARAVRILHQQLGFVEATPGIGRAKNFSISHAASLACL
jgi:hypothetical protein